MPVPSLPPFFTFRPDNFHIGGSVSTLMAAAVRWRTFGDSALEAASAMRSINDGGFEGTEGDRFRELVNSDFPSNLQVTGDAHVGVADAISRYATLLSERKAEMATLETTARGSHAAVNAAAANVNAAEAALAAAPDPASKSAAAAALAAATAEHQAALGVWEGNLATAQGIRTMLGTDAEAQAAIIDTQSRKAFKDNPKPWEAAWDAVSDWLNEHGDILSFIADALQIVGAIAMFICPVVGAVLLGIGVGLKGLLAAAGVVSWGEFAFDLATAGPLGVLGKAVKAGKLGTTAAKGLNKASSMGTKALSSVKSAASSAASKAALKTAGGINRVGSEKLAKSFYRTVTRGDEVCFKLEPVDMATGNMVDFKTDVFIDGILPLVLDRNANTNHELGRALGPRWVSTMDIRLEICADEVLMLAPDGALLTFPPAPTDGSEVRADGRPWLLSYADGAYRVRNIAAGLTYSFRLFDLDCDSEDTASPGVKDESPSLGGSYVAAIIPSGSLAETVDAGMEVGLSSVVHHTGASIEYTWDVVSGHMVRMRRSDGTILDLEWDKAVGRVAHVYVSNPSTHPDEDPLRLISYAYDAYGQLIRVINSNDGALEYHYDEHGRMNAWTDRNGVSYFYRFDEFGRVHSQVGTGGMFPNIVYWADDEGDDAPEGGRLCVAIETAGEFKGDPLELGNSVVDEYFARLEELPLYKALVEGGLTAAGITGRGRTSSRDDETWTVPGEWLHDDFLGDIRPTVYRSTPAGDVWRIVTPEGGIEDTSYNEYHQKTAITNSAGATTSYTFNEDGVLVATAYPGGLTEYVEPGAWAKPVRILGTDGLATECEIDTFGLVSAVTTPAGETTAHSYDVRSSGIVPAATIRPDGTTTAIEADDAGRIIATTDAAGRRTSILRDVRGLPIETIDPAEACTRIEYTPEGWPALVTHPDGTQVSAVYDGEGNQVSSTNEIGAVTTSHFTVFDKLSAATDATGETTRVEYNTQMQPVRLRNADGNVWQYAYDLDGMVVGEIDYNGIARTNTLSADGLTSTVTTPAGTTTYVRHPDGRTHTVSDALGVKTYFYNEFNHLTGIQGPQATIEFERDGYQRIIKETVTLPSGESTVHALTIDATGNVASEHVTLPLGDAFTTTFKRDEGGEIAGTTHTRKLPGSELTEIVAEMRYRKDARGVRSQLSTGSVIRNFGRDARGRTRADTLSVLDNSAEGGLRTVSSRMFTWRNDSALSMVTDFLRGVTSFDLDSVGRVTRLNRISNSRDNSVTEGERSLVEEHYGFTAAGVLNLINAPDPETPLSDNGRSKSDCRVEFNGTMPTRVGRSTYMYDAAGRVIQTVTKRISKKPLTRRFFYASGEQPIGFSTSDEPEIGYRYVYDPLGRRVAKERICSVTGRLIARTVFTHSDDQIIAEQLTYSSEAETSGNGRVWTVDPETGFLTGQIEFAPKRMNVSGVPGPGGQADSTLSFELIMADLAGSPQELVNPDSGDISGTAVQTLYGVRAWTGKSECPLLFMGQYSDAESGWVYNRYRYYDPHAGVYNGQDPLGVSGRIASAQGYVDHAAHWFDALGLEAHSVTVDELRAAGVPESEIARTEKWLNHNPSSREVTVYSAHRKDGSMEYVGQTNDFERRQGEHGERFGNRLREARINTKELSEGAEMFTPHQARALEQSAIVEHRMLKEGGTLVNARNEIAPGRDIHDNVVMWAKHMRAKGAVKFIL
ncbi:DUF6531 domain-containing protein [Corynebacterium sp. Marseille-P3884]|uniref:DUF6531 domain-containing protein n=1 Tax=Corynebacterium sp. Marseille-P3884 TaxID=2495409 RepID=UPI001B332132|nr:DUF6531 domain-containing protein [Corynebacterium sp. Marseille-P3884]MBP3948021.1 type IV secretion protein Rhs [Corynebacterium sp. Marseille-P3884]